MQSHISVHKAAILIGLLTIPLLAPRIGLTSAADEPKVTVTRAEFVSIQRTWENVSLIIEDTYHDSVQVQSEIDQIATAVPELIDMEVIGQSYLGKNISALRITNEMNTEQKAKTLVVAHHHAREQVTIEAALRFILWLINGYGVDETITEYVDTLEIFVIPTINPDGLDLVLHEDRHWLRKNLRPFDDDGDGVADEDGPEDVDGDGKISGFDVYTKETPESQPVYVPSNFEFTYFEGIDNDGDGLVNEDHIGLTDLNRNYDSYWREGPNWSPEPQSQVYPGSTPFSEPETQAFRDFAVNHRFAMAYSLHTGINATFFANGPDGYWFEPTLYWDMVLDFAEILPPSYTEIYFETPSSERKRELASGGSGMWDPWMYEERGTLAPITFEMYRNASSVAPEATIVVVDNDTHYIEEWTEIYGYFTPMAPFIDDLWRDTRPAFEYLMASTPRLDLQIAISETEGIQSGDEVSFEVNCTNLSPLLHTVDRIELVYHDGTAVQAHSMLGPDYTRCFSCTITLSHDLRDGAYNFLIGNEFTGYAAYTLSSSGDWPQDSSDSDEESFSLLASLVLFPVAVVVLRRVRKRE